MEKEALADKTIVITGASSGAGRAAALEFAQSGTYLVLAGRNHKALQEVAGECKKTGARALVVVTDVTDPKAMINLARKAYEWQGGVDVWVNNAGVLAAGDFDLTPMEVHTQVITTNLLGYMNGAHAVLPFFKKQGHGILINNISIGGFLPVPYGAGYTASKFGLRGFSEALKAELTGWKDIHVCDLFPAFLKTPGIQHAANYTGKVLKAAPPVYDPVLVAKAMVRVASDPKSNTYIGGAALLLKSAHALMPELMTNMTGAVMRAYFKVAAKTPDTKGNLFQPVDHNMEVYGSKPGKPKPGRKLARAGLLAGLAIGLYIMKSQRARDTVL